MKNASLEAAVMFDRGRLLIVCSEPSSAQLLRLTGFRWIRWSGQSVSFRIWDAARWLCWFQQRYAINLALKCTDSSHASIWQPRMLMLGIGMWRIWHCGITQRGLGIFEVNHSYQPPRGWLELLQSTDFRHIQARRYLYLRILEHPAADAASWLRIPHYPKR